MPVTQQPDWEFIANLGDMNPLEYGGYFIYKDKTGVYPERADVILPPSEHMTGETLNEIYRIEIERLKLVEGYLVPVRYRRDWNLTFPQPKSKRGGVLEWRPEDIENKLHAQRFAAWFQEHLESVSSSSGTTKEELEIAFTSENPLERFEAYRMIGEYYGWEELGGEPIRRTQKEAEKRYAKELRAIRAGKV